MVKEKIDNNNKSNEWSEFSEKLIEDNIYFFPHSNQNFNKAFNVCLNMKQDQCKEKSDDYLFLVDVSGNIDLFEKSVSLYSKIIIIDHHDTLLRMVFKEGNPIFRHPNVYVIYSDNRTRVISAN